MWYKVYILFNLYTLYKLLNAFSGRISPKIGKVTVQRIHNNKWHNEKYKEQCKEWDDMIDETVIDTRKKDKNVVIISEERYGEMEKAERNSVYLRKLDRGLTQVRAGHGVVKSMAELEAMERKCWQCK